MHIWQQCLIVSEAATEDTSDQSLNLSISVLDIFFFFFEFSFIFASLHFVTASQKILLYVSDSFSQFPTVITRVLFENLLAFTVFMCEY